MNPIGTSCRPVFYHSTFERARSTITAQDGKRAVIKSYDTFYLITNKIYRTLSILSQETGVPIRVGPPVARLRRLRERGRETEV